MKVAVLAEQLLGPVPGGTGRYAREVAAALAETAAPGDAVETWTAWHRDPSAAAVPGTAGPRRLPLPRRPLIAAWERGSPGRCRGTWTSCTPRRCWPRRGGRRPLVVTIHDAVPWTHPETLTPRGVSWHRRMAERVARAGRRGRRPDPRGRRRAGPAPATCPGWRSSARASPATSALPADAAARAGRLGLPDGGFLLTPGDARAAQGSRRADRGAGRPDGSGPAAARRRSARLGWGGPGRLARERDCRRAGCGAGPAIGRRPGDRARPGDGAGRAQPRRGVRAAGARGDARGDAGGLLGRTRRSSRSAGTRCARPRSATRRAGRARWPRWSATPDLRVRDGRARAARAAATTPGSRGRARSGSSTGSDQPATALAEERRAGSRRSRSSAAAAASACSWASSMKPAPPGDLLDAADLPALPFLDDADELGRLHHRGVGAGVEPRGAAVEHGDGQLAPPQVLVVDRGDLQLAAGARLDLRGDLDDLVVVEVEAGDGVGALRPRRLLLDGDDPAVVVELHDAVLLGLATW